MIPLPLFILLAENVKRLKNHGRSLLLKIEEELFHPLYCGDNGTPNDYNQVFYYTKSLGYGEKCLTLLQDADTLFTLYGDGYIGWEEYTFFKRCMSEQPIVNDGTRRLANREAEFANEILLISRYSNCDIVSN